MRKKRKVVRIDPSIHKQAKATAALHGATLQDFTEAALVEKIDALDTIKEAERDG